MDSRRSWRRRGLDVKIYTALFFKSYTWKALYFWTSVSLIQSAPISVAKSLWVSTEENTKTSQERFTRFLIWMYELNSRFIEMGNYLSIENLGNSDPMMHEYGGSWSAWDKHLDKPCSPTRNLHGHSYLSWWLLYWSSATKPGLPVHRLGQPVRRYRQSTSAEEGW